MAGSKSQAEGGAPTSPEFVVPAGRPRLPEHLSADAVKKFKLLCAMLRKRRTLTAGDGEMLRLYAILFDRHERAMAKISVEGEIRIYTRLDAHGEQVEVEKHNLWLKVAETSEQKMVAILDRLGLSPMNRQKAKPIPTPPPPPPADEYPVGSVGWFEQETARQKAAHEQQQQQDALHNQQKQEEENAADLQQ